MPQGPTGTVTFLFTDIEGSAQLWERHPDAMDVALARHDAILRNAIESHDGRVFATGGDAFCAAFSTPIDALEAALAAQRALLAQEWGEVGPLRVRMAVNTGVADEREGDYFGPPLNRTARLLSAGHGGQVLVSAAVEEILAGPLPEGMALCSLGAHRLRDLLRPSRVFHLTAAGLPAEFPALMSLDAYPTNLPVQVTSFIGRERELAEVRRLLGATRLLTLTGVGGTGKTRLAVQGAADMLDEYPDGVWHVELAPIADATLVTQVVASALGLREEPHRSIEVILMEHLRERRLLLLLDNCEHLVDACAQLSDAVLHAAPEVRILATSREAMRIGGETAWPVPSLVLPEPGRAWGTAAADIGALTQCEAVRLFIERALAVHPSFKVTNKNAPAVAEVCHRLDGIPLAIELAAARMKHLSVAELLARLDDRFRLLTGGSRTALPRHQTLRATIDWSHDLLSEREQTLFRRLAVFRGGWSTELAEAACSDDFLDCGDVLDVLASLVDQSLVAMDEDDGHARQRFLRSVRTYAHERLVEHGEIALVRARHLALFRDLAEEAEPELTGPDQLVWLDRLELEHENLRAALDFARSPDAEPGDLLRLACVLGRFWHARGYLSEGSAYLEAALERGGSVEPRYRAKALTWAGNLAYELGEFAVARAHHEENLAIQRELGSEQGVAGCLGNLGLLALRQGEYAEARNLLDETLAIAEKLGDEWTVALTHNNLGLIAFETGDYAQAKRHQEQSLAMLRELGHMAGVALLQSNLAMSDTGLGDYASARRRHGEALTLLRQLDDGKANAAALEGVLHLFVALEQHARAARLAGAASALRDRIGAPLPPNEREQHESDMAAVRAAIGLEPCDASFAEGLALTMDEAVAYALEEVTWSELADEVAAR